MKRLPKRLTRRTDDGSVDFARKLRLIRDAAGGYTIPVWAGVLGVSQRTLLNWENGYTRPTRGQAFEMLLRLRDGDEDPAITQRLAEHFGVHADIVGVVPDAPQTPAPPRPAMSDVRAHLVAAIYESAEEAEIPAAKLRRAVAAVIEAARASGATIEEARAALAMSDAAEKKGTKP
jgi:DNA-binding transcriptional regulator YiaG